MFKQRLRPESRSPGELGSRSMAPAPVAISTEAPNAPMTEEENFMTGEAKGWVAPQRARMQAPGLREVAAKVGEGFWLERWARR